jgi:hypothetical protein
MTDLTEVWVYLSASPLLFLTLTLAAFQAGSWVYERSGHKPFLNPVMTAVILLVAILTLTQDPLPGLFRGRAVRALPARPRNGGAGDPSLPAIRAGAALGAGAGRKPHLAAR